METDSSGAGSSSLQKARVAWRRSNQEFHLEPISLPRHYSPDLDDRLFRGKHLPNDAFHTLGMGSIDMVIAAILRRGDGQQKVAMKRYDFKRIAHLPRGYTILLREIQNTQYLTHPNIVKMIDNFFVEDARGDIEHVYIVTEHMDCSLRHYFGRLNALSANEKPRLRDHRHVSSLLVQLFRALDYLHERGVMHLDVTPKSIGMNCRNFEIKLLGFGSSEFTNSLRETTKIVSTPPIYRPLEMLLEERYDCSVDIWAVALVALEMLGCKLMFPKNTDLNQKTYKNVQTRILDVLGLNGHDRERVFPNSLRGEELRPSTLLQELEEPLARLEPDRSWLTGEALKSLLLMILVLDPHKRPTARECLEHPYINKMNARMASNQLTADDFERKNDHDRVQLSEMLRRFSKSYHHE